MLQSAAAIQGQKIFYDEIIINDTHLGHASARPGVVREILIHTESSRLIIAGDFFDLWELAKKPEWRLAEAERDILALLADKVAKGTEVVFIPGNHEDALRREGMLGRRLFGMAFMERLQVRDESGRIVREYSHGDQYDDINTQLGPLIHSIGYHTGGAYLYHPVQRVYNRLQPGIRAAMEQYADQRPYLKKFFPTTAEKISREAEQHGVVRQDTPTAHRVHRGALKDAMARGIGENFFGHSHAPIHLSALTRDGQVVSIIDTGDVFENTTMAVRVNNETRLVDWLQERQKIGLDGIVRPALSVSEDARKTALRQERLLHRLVPGTGRKKALQAIRAHLEKAEERRARAALFREAASVMTLARPIKSELRHLLQKEFARFAEKIRDIECQLVEMDAGFLKRHKLDKKLLWHKSVHRALGSALSDRLLFRMWMPCEKIRDVFERKAQRFDRRADESLVRAEAVRVRLRAGCSREKGPDSALSLDIAA